MSSSVSSMSVATATATATAASAAAKKYSIYNPNNRILNRKDLVDILARADINNRPKNLDVWQQSFVHDSYTLQFRPKNADSVEYENALQDKPDDVVPLQDKSNQRLEWLGDGIIQSIVAAYLWKKYPDEDEGFLTKTRSKLVKTESLANFASILGLNEFILMSDYMESASNGRVNPRILEDTFEAFVGAMFLDFGRTDEMKGYSVCKNFIVFMIEHHINIDELISRDDNYKDQLMRFYQKNFAGKIAVYKEFADSNQNILIEPGKPIIRSFHVYVLDPEGTKIVGEGRGKTKKEAEQMAAKRALIKYGVIPANAA
jgi:dsRNA-specific ribonuclease